MASRAMSCMDHHPAIQAAATRTKMRNLFSTEKSMIRVKIWKFECQCECE